jgi:peptidyl-prolyl cis-trans isomerase B (cyclophilin B)
MLRRNAPPWIPLALGLLLPGLLVPGLLLPGLLVMALAGCAADEPGQGAASKPDASAETLIGAGPHDRAVLELGDLGTITLELLPELAPQTVENFLKLASEGFYNGTSFHRVIPDFMIQGGDPNTRDNDPRDDGKGGPGYNIQDEFNALPHVRGVVSMANKGNRGSAGSQFFIVHADKTALDGQYTAFARVVEGMDVVDAITKLEIDTYGRYGPRDRPYPESAVIEGVRIEGAAIGRADP